MQAETNGPPLEVARLSNAVEGIPGISEASVGKTNLSDIAVSDLSLGGFYADLPIAVLRRSDGALPTELLLSIDFSISKDVQGLKALEFLAWWVRDQSRGGENMQLRSIALPPIAGGTVQLGETLRFTIDWFYNDPTENAAKVLQAIDNAAHDLETVIRLYQEAFQ
jgi:hypothetical protein